MKKFLSMFLVFPMASMLFADDATGSSGGLTQMLIMVGVAVVFFYFILFRPEQKRRKKVERQRKAMKKGDKVTAMGIIGTLANIKEETVIVKMCDGSKIEFLKAAITDVVPMESTTQEPEKETETAKS